MALTRFVCGGVDVVDTDLLGKLSADVALMGLVDGVELEVDHDLAAAIDEVGEGEVDVGQSLCGARMTRVPALLSTVICLTSKTLRTTLPSSFICSLVMPGM